MAHKKTTSKGVASKASKALKDGRTGKSTKSIAGSALSQKHGAGHDKPATGKVSKPRPGTKGKR